MTRGFFAGAVRAFALLAVAAVPLPAAAQAPEQQAGIDFALKRGRLLFELDRAAWVATDDMIERMPGWRDSSLGGYVIEPDGAGYAVTFYGGPAEAPVAFYSARIEKRRVASSEVHPAGARPALSPTQRRLVAARDAARTAADGRPRCADAPFNLAAIPPASADAPVDVYLLTPQVAKGAFPFGGHYRLTVAADGKVAGERAFTKSCLTMAGDGHQGAAMVVSHLLDPVPTEIHVFTALTSGLPVYVAVEGDRLYEVTGDRVRLVEQKR